MQNEAGRTPTWRIRPVNYRLMNASRGDLVAVTLGIVHGRQRVRTSSSQHEGQQRAGDAETESHEIHAPGLIEQPEDHGAPTDERGRDSPGVLALPRGDAREHHTGPHCQSVDERCVDQQVQEPGQIHGRSTEHCCQNIFQHGTHSLNAHTQLVQIF